MQTSSVTEWETLFLKWHNMACSLWYVRFLETNSWYDYLINYYRYVLEHLELHLSVFYL